MMRACHVGASIALALSLGGCMLRGDRAVAVAAPEVAAPDAPASLPHAASRPAVKRVRRAEAEADGTAPTSGTPSPRQIFDFHPPGSAADTWREPFIIDPNDGPLAADVRRSAAELRAFLAMPKSDIAAAGTRRCSESDVAKGPSGCIGGVPAPVRGAAVVPATDQAPN